MPFALLAIYGARSNLQLFNAVCTATAMGMEIQTDKYSRLATAAFVYFPNMIDSTVEEKLAVAKNK